MKKGAIFDMDGLLFDTERVWQRVWHERADELGVTLPDSFAGEICGSSGQGTLDIITRCYPGVEPVSFHREVQNEVARRLENSVPLRPGCEEILAGLAERGLKIAVASSSQLSHIEHHMRLTGLGHYFDRLVSGQQVKRGKPAPDIFLLAASELGLSPEDCYVFEDSPNGVKAGHAAGCAVIMIPDLITPTEEIRALCTGIFTSLSEALRKLPD